MLEMILLFANVIGFAFMFALWSSRNLANVSFKLLWLGLSVLNVVDFVQVAVK